MAPIRNVAARVAVLIVALGFVGLVNPSQAAGLSDDEISRWAESMDELRPWGKKHESKLQDGGFENKAPAFNPMAPPTDEDIARMRSPFSNAVKTAEKAGLGGELSGILAGHGFSSSEWGELGDRIMRAYFALMMEGGPSMRGELDSTIAQMESAQGIPQAQKDQIINSLRRTVEVYEMMSDAPAEDVEAAARNKALLDATFNE